MEQGEYKVTPKFSMETEEVYCVDCVAVTGHVLTGKYWTCVHCGTQQGKKRPFWQRCEDKINFYFFKRKL